MSKVSKNIAVLFLLFIITLQSNNLIIYYSLFKLNQKNLTAQVCEKKTEGCNACCYLNKKLNEGEGKADPVDKKTDKLSLEISKYVVEQSSVSPSSHVSNKYFSSNNIFIHPGFHSSLEHPPQS